MTMIGDTAKIRAGAEYLLRRKAYKDLQLRAWDDPKWFINQYLGRPTFGKQDDVALSVRDHRRTTVKGANSSGKDYQSGNIVNWWEFVHDDAITIVYGPTMRQVRDIVWREARRAFDGAIGEMPGYMYPKNAKYYIDEYRYAEGFSASPEEQTGSGIQGFHSPHTLLIVTEAHAVPAAEIEALMRLNPYRVLLTGNTLVQAGEFYEAFYEKSWLYNQISISAFDTPNILEQRVVIPGMITQQDVDECAREYGTDSPMYRARVLAEFSDNLEDAIISRSLLIAARDRGLETEPAGEGDELPRASLSCDVARFGDDDTVVYRRQGRHNYCAWRTHGQDLMRIAGRLRLMAENDPDVDRIVIDDTGIGGGVTDRLKETPIRGGQVRIIPFRGGSRAVNQLRYVNAISEAWIEAARALSPDPATGRPSDVTIDDNPRLIGQMASRKYRVQSDARLALEQKDQYKKRTRQSPDDADAFAMNYSPFTNRRWGVL